MCGDLASPCAVFWLRRGALTPRRGSDAATLYCDNSVKFGGEEVGGTRISHLSNISKALSVPLLVTRGRSGMFKVQPLKEEPRPTEADVTACTDRDALTVMWRTHTDLRPAIEARVAELDAQAKSTTTEADTLPVGGEA